MSDFQIPASVAQRIEGDPKLVSSLNGLVAATGPWNGTTPVFFPEYTDHTARHNQEVLDTALSLLTDPALERLSPKDYLVLTSAVLLHDLGMHLTDDGFATLVGSKNTQVHKLDNQTWPDLWQSFLAEAKRFDGAYLTQLFGSPNPVQEPPSDPRQFNTFDKLLIGEFLRRYHPRLGHDIAVFGFPGAGGTFLPIMDGFSNEIADLCGLIARSHGQPLRHSIDILRDEFHERAFQHVHAPVLMATLRIADYVQIQPDRAPTGTQKVKRFSSPFSKGEWKVHQAVKNITTAHSDPEAIDIRVEPGDVETFLKFKSWASGVQIELDATWAALGEVYGRWEQEGFDKFGLKLRRVRTNIDDVQTFAETVDYLPESIAFEAASAELLSLLVAPLYGDKPEIGLRELIQNSVDAVLERWHLEGIDPDTLSDDRDAEVTIYPGLEDEKVVRVVVEDRGIGMDANIIKNFFLKAGASFRNSDAWKANFADEKGQSQVRRSGRFGVGALACFLIGNRISVTTRRLGGETGFQFDAELGMPSIEVSKCNADVGTRIVVHVPRAWQERTTGLFFKADPIVRAHDEPKQSQKWDWFLLEKPKVSRISISSDPMESGWKFIDGPAWRCYPFGQTGLARWAYTDQIDGFPRHDIPLICNGIEVISDQQWRSRNQLVSSAVLSMEYELQMPAIVINDPSAELPLNLQRDALASNHPQFERRLKASICNDLIAEILAKSPEHATFERGTRADLNRRSLHLHQRRDYYDSWNTKHLDFSWSGDTWLLSDSGLMPQSRGLLLQPYDAGVLGFDELKGPGASYSISWIGNRPSISDLSSCLRFLRDVFRHKVWSRGSYMGTVWMACSDQFLQRTKNSKMPQWLEQLIAENARSFGGGWLLTDSVSENALVDKLETHIDYSNGMHVPFIVVTNQQTDLPEDDLPLLISWKRYIGETPIPLKYEDREAAFPLAYQELGDRIRFHRQWFLTQTKRHTT